VDTFQAAATFFELVNIWGPPDAVTQAKIKYAKWNAVRIAKALKEGKDPNESNPKPLPKEEPLPPINPNAIDELEGSLPERSLHATVEEVPDVQDQFNGEVAPVSVQAPVQASSMSPMHPKPEFSPKDEFPHVDIYNDNVSPFESSQRNDRSGSIGGGFFPLPTFTAETNNSTLPTAPSEDVNDLVLPDQPSFAPASRVAPTFEPPPSNPEEPQDYYRINSPHVQPSPVISPQTAPTRPVPHQPQNFQSQTPPQYAQTTAPYQRIIQPHPMQSRATGSNLVEVDDEAIAQAQKHARWAISALNFEDTQTAVKELKEALRRLGAET
jgi:vacuolar protein sorting-associated protein VTA1